jgi:hypothetical protein
LRIKDQKNPIQKDKFEAFKNTYCTKILFEENTLRLASGSKEEKFEKRMVFHKTKNRISSIEYLEALPRGSFILLNIFAKIFKMKKSLLLFSIVSLFFSCNKKESKQTAQSLNPKSNKEIQDSINLSSINNFE